MPDAAGMELLQTRGHLRLEPGHQHSGVRAREPVDRLFDLRERLSLTEDGLRNADAERAMEIQAKSGSDRERRFSEAPARFRDIDLSFRELFEDAPIRFVHDVQDRPDAPLRSSSPARSARIAACSSVTPAVASR